MRAEKRVGHNCARPLHLLEVPRLVFWERVSVIGECKLWEDLEGDIRVWCQLGNDDGGGDWGRFHLLGGSLLSLSVLSFIIGK